MNEKKGLLHTQRQRLEYFERKRQRTGKKLERENKQEKDKETVQYKREK